MGASSKKLSVEEVAAMETLTEVPVRKLSNPQDAEKVSTVDDTNVPPQVSNMDTVKDSHADSLIDGEDFADKKLISSL